MKFEELKNYVKEQYEINKDQEEEYNKKLEEYNKQKEEYLKEKDRIEKTYDEKIYSISETIESETKIAQEKAIMLFNNELIEFYKRSYEHDVGYYDTKYEHWACYTSKFLGISTTLVDEKDENWNNHDYSSEYRCDDSSGYYYNKHVGIRYRIFPKNGGPFSIQRASERFFVKNIDLFMKLKNFDKSFIDYKILEEIKSLLIDKGATYGMQGHQSIKKLRLEQDSLKQQLAELEKKLEKRFVLRKKEIKEQIQEVRAGIAEIARKIEYQQNIGECINECSIYIAKFNQGEIPQINFKRKDLNDLFKLMQDSIEVLISKSESVKQKETEIVDLRQNKEQEIKKYQEPQPPKKITLAEIYRAEWAADEELVEEIKTSSDENLEPYVKEIFNMIIEANRKINIERQNKEFSEL